MADTEGPVSLSSSMSKPSATNASLAASLSSHATLPHNPVQLPKINPGPFQIHLARPKMIDDTHSSPLQGLDHINTTIQNTWAMFSAMMDSERNLLLKGLLDRCSSKQIEFICTAMNLRTAETTISGKMISLHPSEFAQKAMVAPKKKTHLPVKKPDYEKPWQVGSKMSSPNRYVASLQTDLREQTPMRLHDGLTFEQVANEAVKMTPHHRNMIESSGKDGFVNQNGYMRLYNSQFDMQKVNNQSKIAKPDASQRVLQFLTEGYKKLQFLLKYLHTISGEQSVDNAIKEVLKCVTETTGAKYVSIYLIDESTQDFQVSASNWHVLPKRLPSTGVFCGKSILGRQPCNMYNVKTSEEYTEEVDNIYSSLDCECILSVPIVQANSRNIGILEIINKENGSPFFTSDDEFLLRSISYICTLLVIHNNIKPESNKKADNIKMLLNTASMMTSEMEIVDLVRVIMQKALELISAERCSIFMVDEVKQELWSTISSGSAQIRIPITTGIAGYVATTGETCNIPDAYADSRFNRAVDIKTGYRTRTILCMPMRNGNGRVIGVTQIINKLPENQMFSKEDETILQSFSALAAATVEKTVLFNSLQTSLDKASLKKNYFGMYLNNCKNIVMTLDHQGFLDILNRPKDFSLIEATLHEMRTKHYEIWLGKENQILLDDINKVYGPVKQLRGYNYELKLADKSFTVNYYIVKTSEYTDSSIQSQDPGSGKKMEDPKGVIIEMELMTPTVREEETIGRYFPPNIAHTCMANNSMALEGMRQKVSMMVVDIRNFSSIVETLNPSEVVTLLNEHFSGIHESIVAEQGCLDKFMGDAVLGIFGTPFAHPEDSKRAVLSALRIKAAVTSLNAKNMQNLAHPQVRVGIGISTTTMVTGSVGSSTRREYSVLGDGVNLAQCIEKATKNYGTSILVCDRTRNEIRDYFHLREIDTIQIKGRTKPIVVYEVLGPSSTELPREIMTALICFELGLAEYRQQNWAMAISHFSKAVHLTDDTPSKTFIGRCRAVLDGRYEIPRDGWDYTWA